MRYGDSVDQFFSMLSKVPGTRTTGWGCAAEGLHDQSLAPGGATSTVSADAATGVAPMSRSRIMPPPVAVTTARPAMPTTSMRFCTASSAPEMANARMPTRPFTAA